MTEKGNIPKKNKEKKVAKKKEKTVPKKKGDIICSECKRILNWKEVECCNVCHRPLSCPNCDAEFVETFECHICGTNCVDCIYYDESSDSGGFYGDEYCGELHCKKCADTPEIGRKCLICLSRGRSIVCPEAEYVDCSCGKIRIHTYCRDHHTDILPDYGNCLQCGLMLCEDCQWVCSECGNIFCEECGSDGCPKCSRIGLV